MMNLKFCLDSSFSNERISTFLTVMDVVLRRMTEEHLHSDSGFKLMSKLLAQHSLHRPPFSIAVFSENDIEEIKKYSLTSFFKHYSLYEFAFKPRVELVFKIKPVVPVVAAPEEFEGAQEIEDPGTLACLAEYLPERDDVETQSLHPS